MIVCKFLRKANFSPCVFLTPIVVGLFSFGCIKPKNDQSRIQWGHLGGISTSYFLVALPPQSKITVCGDSRTIVANALRIWAEGAGRAEHLTIDDACSPNATKQIQVYGIKDGEPQTGACNKVNINTGVSNTAGYSIVEYGAIKICPASAKYDSDSMFALLLHEVGHLWGMCDQYGHAVNCDENNKGPVDKNSVMGASYSRSLAADDLRGIRALTNRTDVPNYNLWRSLASKNSDKINQEQNSNNEKKNPESAKTNAEKCHAAGGKWTNQGFQDGEYRCDCGRILLHQSIVSSNSVEELKKRCGGGSGGSSSTVPSNTPKPIPTPTTSAKPNEPSDLAEWCRAANGQWGIFGMSDGMNRCICRSGSLSFREDAMRYHGREAFIAQCR